MLINIDPATGTVTRLDGQKDSLFGPVIEEYNGWQEYTKLHKETGDNKYAVAAHEEFRHMLLRLSKALEKIEGMLTTDAEKAELMNFRKAITE